MISWFRVPLGFLSGALALQAEGHPMSVDFEPQRTETPLTVALSNAIVGLLRERCARREAPRSPRSLAETCSR